MKDDLTVDIVREMGKGYDMLAAKVWAASGEPWRTKQLGERVAVEVPDRITTLEAERDAAYAVLAQIAEYPYQFGQHVQRLKGLAIRALQDKPAG